MKIEKLEKASALLDEMKDLKKYKDLFKDRNNGNVAHFEVVQHYGKLETYDRVDIPKRFNTAFTHLLENCIKEIEDEIKEF